MAWALMNDPSLSSLPAAGRFDRTVFVPKADLNGRREILQVRLGGGGYGLVPVGRLLAAQGVGGRASHGAARALQRRPAVVAAWLNWLPALSPTLQVHLNKRPHDDDMDLSAILAASE